MKKSILFIIAAMLIAMYINYNRTSIPSAAERKVLTSGQSESGAEAALIKVMTYNIHRGINVKGELDLDGIAEVIKASGADIVSLQEVERFSIRTGFKDQIKYIADKLSMQYVFGKSINILNGEYGNGILSRFRIEEHQVSQLTSQGEQRTLLRARLNVHGNIISVYNTHLGLTQSERNKQLDEIMKMSVEDKSLLLTGDFNTSADKLEVITAKFIDSGSFGDGKDKATFEKDGLSERIDYIFASRSFAVKEYNIVEAYTSDHFPVVSILEITD